MALTLSPVLNNKPALTALLGLGVIGLGAVGYVQWNDAPQGLYGEGSGAGRSIATGSANVGSLTGIDVVDNALAALTGRSPGARTVGVSGKGKGKGPVRAYRYSRSPAAQALDEAFSSPVGASRVIDARRPETSPGLTLPPAVFGTEAGPGITSAIAPAAGAVPGGSGGGAFFPPGGFSVGGIGGGGGGGGGVPPIGGGGGIGVPPIGGGGTTPALPAVPEPSTWLMMLLGMAMVGGALRSGKAMPRMLPTTL